MNKQIGQKTTDNKFSTKRLALLVVLVLFSIATICGLIYWKLDQVIQIKNNQMHLLTDQINTASERIHDLSAK